MKKFLLFSFFAGFALLGKSQDFIVMADTDQVKDGDVIELTVAPEIMGDYAFFEWNPKLSARSTGEDLDVALTINTEDAGFTICWPEMCVEVTPGVPKVTDGVLHSESADLQIHCMLNMTVEEAANFKKAEANISIQPVGQKKMSFTLVCTPTEFNAVESVNAESEIIGIYDLTGRKLDRRQPGINLILHSDGRVTKVLNEF